MGGLFEQPLLTAQQRHLVERINQRFHESVVQRCQFRQVRHLRLLTMPLITEGQLIFHAQHGVLWRITNPFPATILIDERHMIQWQGRQVQVITAKRQPALFAMAQVLTNVISGDMERLESKFQVFVTGDTDHWELGLIPKGETLVGLIRDLRLVGRQSVERVEMYDQRGERTSITLSQVIGDTTLSAEELRFFTDILQY
jgi:outer membrane lipoprotein-sorting protein